MSVRVDRRVREKIRRKVRMLEQTIYGLVWLAAILVIAFCFVYADEFSPARERSSFDLINNAHFERFSDNRDWNRESTVPGDGWEAWLTMTRLLLCWHDTRTPCRFWLTWKS
jgi:hypothetical protein